MAYTVYCRDFDNLFLTYELYAWVLLDCQLFLKFFVASED